MESLFQIDRGDGKPLDSEQYLSISGVKETKDGTRVTLHGFETVAWDSGPGLPKSEDPSGTRVQKPFQFLYSFVVTSPVK